MVMKTSVVLYRLFFETCGAYSFWQPKLKATSLLIKQLQLPRIPIELVLLRLRSQNLKLHLICPILLINKYDLLLIWFLALHFWSQLDLLRVWSLWCHYVLHFSQSLCLGGEFLPDRDTHTSLHICAVKILCAILNYLVAMGKTPASREHCFLSIASENFFWDVLFKTVMTTWCKR